MPKITPDVGSSDKPGGTPKAANAGPGKPSTGSTVEPDKPKPTVAQEPPFGMSLADWSPMSWLDPRRFESLWSLSPTTPPATAMLAMANSVPLRGSSASWGMARVMIDSGVPRAVAWPAAEANAAALDAADAASNGFRTVVASFHTESGYASVARSMTPTLMVLALTLGASLTPLAPMAGWSSS